MDCGAGIDLPSWICEHSTILLRGLHIGFLAFLFGTISVAAYDFMCPNLRALSSRSGLSANVIGVVFVAFGNSSVDIFGAIAAISAGANALAIGELIGAALFICTVVVGSMALFGQIDVEPKFFKRDGQFLLVASIVVLYIIYDGVITLIEVLSLLALYAVYAIVVAMDHFDHAKAQDDLYADVTRNIGIYHEERAEESSIPGSPMPVRSSLLSAHEFHDAVLENSLFPENNTRRSGTISRRSPRFSPHPSPLPSSPSTASKPDTLKAPDTSIPDNCTEQISNTMAEPPQTPKTSNSHSERASPRSSSPRSKSIPPLNLSQDLEAQDRPVLASLVITSPGDEICQTPRVHVEYETDPLLPQTDFSVWHHLFPLFRDFKDRHWLAQLHSLVMAIPVFGLAISVPVADDHCYCPPIGYLMHAIGAPIALLLLVDHFYLALAAIICVWILLFIAYRRQQSLALSWLGFAMSVVWVVNLAELVITELQIIGEDLGISETFLGLTVFAIGDSLGDLVTNITIARLGMSTMAISACFAGPFMTMLIGIGLGSLVAMIMNRQTVIPMPVDRQIFVSGPLLVLVLIGLQVCVKYNSWRITPAMGVVLISLWILSVIVNVLIS